MKSITFTALLMSIVLLLDDVSGGDGGEMGRRGGGGVGGRAGCRRACKQFP